MSRAVSDLLSILDLEPLEVNLFRGQSPKSGWQRVFGGQVIGQALVAATRTVDGRPPHSLHCYFMLPGDPRIPIIYEVERIRDGGLDEIRLIVTPHQEFGLDVEGDVAMREHDALRVAGRAGGIDQRRYVVGAHGGFRAHLSVLPGGA